MSDMPLPDLQASRPGRRAAWTLVIIMTVLFLLALVAVIWGFLRQARILLADRSAPAATAAQPGAAAVLTLAPGARIVSVRTEAGKLILQVSAPAGDEVEIIDLQSGKLTGQIKSGQTKMGP